MTSTLVMDALYCGCRSLDAGSTSVTDAVKESANLSHGSAALSIATNTCVLTGDLVCALERAADGTAFDVDDLDLDDSVDGRSRSVLNSARVTIKIVPKKTTIVKMRRRRRRVFLRLMQWRETNIALPNSAAKRLRCTSCLAYLTNVSKSPFAKPKL